MHIVELVHLRNEFRKRGWYMRSITGNVQGSKRRGEQKWKLKNTGKNVKKMIYKSCLNYMGNKYKLIKERRIHEFIPKINHDNPYCELFCGSAVMFFNIEAPFAFLNDINKELQNFWKVIRDRYDEFQERIKYYWPGMVVDVKDEIDSAVQFYISNLLSNFITKPLKLDKTIEFWKKKLDSVRLWIDCRPK